jgi:hypothetical protein
VVFNWPLMTPALTAIAADTAGSTVKVCALALQKGRLSIIAKIENFKLWVFMMVDFG